MPSRRPPIPAGILSNLRRICLALEGVSEEQAWSGTRWVVRKRNFAHVVAIAGGWPPAYARAAGTDGPAIVLTFRASGELSDTLRSAGPPFFHAPWGTQWGTQVIGMLLGARINWDEVATLVRESYRAVTARATRERASARRRARP